MVAQPDLKAPFPWFGGKSRAAALIWDRLGDVNNYVEPFAGSLAVLLGRPTEPRIETVNDKDGYIANFWRAVAVEPGQVADYANWPVNAADLTARNIWLTNKRDELLLRLMGDPDWYDVKIAGWWVWGISCSIGNNWCGGNGPWISVDGMLTKRDDKSVRGVRNARPHVAGYTYGIGVHQNLRGVCNVMPNVDGLGHGKGVHSKNANLVEWFGRLSARLRKTRVCCGEWTKVLGNSPLRGSGPTGIVLDPPYKHDDRRPEIYAEDSPDIAAAVGAWAKEHGDNPDYRIALCGYEDAYDLPGWDAVGWKAHGGYANSLEDNPNATRETIWFSPHCVQPTRQLSFI